MPVESSYRMESARDFIGTEGGVIYAPANTFHASRFQGNGKSRRLAMNEFTNIAHWFDEVVPYIQWLI